MKGIVFNILEQVVTQTYGEDTWESLLATAGVDGAYTAVGSYEDSQMAALVAAASQALGTPEDDILRWFGTAALPVFAERYPQFFAPHTTTRSFLTTLNDVIHPEVRKLFPGAYAPEFTFDDRDDALAMGYHSHRQLCAFGEGLILGAAAHFGESVSIEQASCQKRGDDACTFLVRTNAVA